MTRGASELHYVFALPLVVVGCWCRFDPFTSRSSCTFSYFMSTLISCLTLSRRLIGTPSISCRISLKNLIWEWLRSLPKCWNFEFQLNSTKSQRLTRSEFVLTFPPYSLAVQRLKCRPCFFRQVSWEISKGFLGNYCLRINGGLTGVVWRENSSCFS